MNLYFIEHNFGFEHDYNYVNSIDWIPYTHEAKSLPVKKLKGQKGHAFNSSYFHKNKHFYVESLFWPDGFYELEDLLLSGGNNAECGLFENNIVMFRVNPVSPSFSKPFPNYREISTQKPGDLYYFTKYKETNFRLVDQVFFNRIQENGLKGLQCVLRWDGNVSYPTLI